VLNNETISQAIFLGTVLIMSGLVVYEWGGRLAWPQPARADDV
jgi:hypothetical protein